MILFHVVLYSLGCLLFLDCLSYADNQKEPSCGPGRGGNDCAFSMSMIFFEHDPYLNFHLRPKDLDGWSPSADVYVNLCKEVDAKVIVEVGVWKGLSASYLAGYLKSQGNGVLFCS